MQRGRNEKCYTWGKAIPVISAPHLTPALFATLLLFHVLQTSVFPEDPQPFLKGCWINHAADFTCQSPSISLMFMSMSCVAPLHCPTLNASHRNNHWFSLFFYWCRRKLVIIKVDEREMLTQVNSLILSRQRNFVKYRASSSRSVRDYDNHCKHLQNKSRQYAEHRRQRIIK